MHSTLKHRDSDPHDVFAIAPDVVPAAWADKVLADIQRDARSDADVTSPDVTSLDVKYPDADSPASDQLPPSASNFAAPAPTVDTTFRATATDDHLVPAARSSTNRWTKSAIVAFMFALCSALAAAAWEHYGDAAQQVIANWTPPFALTSSPPEASPAGQADTPPGVQASAADRTAPHAALPAQPAESIGSSAASSPDPAQLHSMAGDLAAMAQQVDQLRASIAELKASQQAIARDLAKAGEAKASMQTPRPRVSPPPRSAAAPPRGTLPANPPAPAAAPLTQTVLPPASAMPAPPPPQATARSEDEPIVRPPMPLR
ncbi:hypothetical protein [Bradyrhizobium sp.]|uniref:hypothetical protein n=1 Tax=Bradyrhizobium sp. TaxID=376 RepID=UPI000A43B6D6|nr:hypothetical protein [Bradyrhizobium sp.]